MAITDIFRKVDRANTEAVLPTGTDGTQDGARTVDIGEVNGEKRENNNFQMKRVVTTPPPKKDEPEDTDGDIDNESKEPEVSEAEKAVFEKAKKFVADKFNTDNDYDFKDAETDDNPGDGETEESEVDNDKRAKDDEKPAEGEVDEKDAKKEDAAIPNDVYVLAKQFGISISEVNDLGLDRTVDILDKLSKEAEQASPKKDENGDEKKTDSEDEFKLNLPEEDIEYLDKPVVDALKSMEKQINELLKDKKVKEREFLQTQQMLQQKALEQHFDEFDRTVDALGKKDVFGEGTPEPDTDSYKNRDKLYRRMELLADGYASKEGKVPEMGQLVKEAMLLEYGDSMKEEARKELIEKVDKRKSQTLLKPSDNATESLEEKKRSVVGLAAKIMRKSGILPPNAT